MDGDSSTSPTSSSSPSPNATEYDDMEPVEEPQDARMVLWNKCMTKLIHLVKRYNPNSIRSSADIEDSDNSDDSEANELCEEQEQIVLYFATMYNNLHIFSETSVGREDIQQSLARQHTLLKEIACHLAGTEENVLPDPNEDPGILLQQEVVQVPMCDLSIYYLVWLEEQLDDTDQGDALYQMYSRLWKYTNWEDICIDRSNDAADVSVSYFFQMICTVSIWAEFATSLPGIDKLRRVENCKTCLSQTPDVEKDDMVNSFRLLLLNMLSQL